VSKDGILISRRRLLKATAAVGTVALASPPIVSQASDVLVLDSQGGEYIDIIQRSVIKPFEKKFGVSVTYSSTGTAAQTYAKIRATGGNPGFDVAGLLTAAQLALGGREKVLLPLTESDVPNLRYIWDRTKTTLPFGVAHSVQYACLLHLKDRLDAPVSWRDYWDPASRYGEKVRGRVLNLNPATILSPFVLILAAELDGGSANNMLSAWELLKKQKPYVGSVQTTMAQVVTLLEQKQIWLTPFWSARGFYYVKQGMPVQMTIPKEGTLALAECAAIPAGASNQKLAKEFINFWLSPETQQAYALAYNISPGRGDITGWPEDFKKGQIVTADQMASVRLPDMTLIADQLRDWTAKWQEIMG
jgi:putative spermidine/putrescine transport system substrate-binding protein